MRFELMLPHQIREAIADLLPVVLPLGVLEYHGEHLGVGMDTLAVVRALEQLEREMPLVLLPPFYYGAASYRWRRPTAPARCRWTPRACSLRGGDFGGIARTNRNVRADHPPPRPRTSCGHANRPCVRSGAAGDLPAPGGRASGARDGGGGPRWPALRRARHRCRSVQLDPIASTNPSRIDYPFDHAGVGERRGAGAGGVGHGHGSAGTR